MQLVNPLRANASQTTDSSRRIRQRRKESWFLGGSQPKQSTTVLLVWFGQDLSLKQCAKRPACTTRQPLHFATVVHAA